MTTVVPAHGSAGRFYYHTLDMSDYVESVKADFKRDLAPYKPLGASSPTQVQGRMSMVMTLGGAALVQDAGGDEDITWTAMGSDAARMFAYAPYGDTLAGLAFCGKSQYGGHSMEAGDDVLRMPVGVIASADVDKCVILRALAADGTSPGTYVDDIGAASANGGAGYLIVTAIGAGATLTVTIADSDDHITFAPLVTFTGVTPANLATYGSQVGVVAPLATVERYLRVEWTLTGGAATATWFAAFGRR